MSETTCPVLFPSEEEFRNFYQYINTIEAKYPDICICKIVPPKSWKARKDYNINKIDLNITYPVKQSISGRSGIYSVTLFELKTFTLQQFYEKSLKMEYKKDENNFKERERQFWRSLGGTSGLGDPIYGADVEGTLFTSDISHPTWNLNNLENLLNIFRIKLPGINTPMMYIGSWRAMFAWHVEDMDLYSINYLHYGACKSWYSIPPSLRKRFETFMNGYYPAEYSQCKDYLRHKTQLVSPTRLREQNIPYQQCVQHPGEFVVTFPGAYHSGFNHGFNIAEATNFATERWIQIGIQASFCNCRPGSVTINMEEFETYYLREKKRLKELSGGNIRSLLQNNNNTLMKIQETPFNDPYEYFVDDTVYDDNNYFNEQEDRVRCVRGVCTMVMIPPNYRDPLVVKERERLSYYNSYYDCYCCDSDSVEHYSLQQCKKCDLYYHPQCIIDTFEQDGYDLSYLKEKICHVCYFIDSSDVFRTYDEEEGNSKKNKSNRRKKRKEEEINQSFSSSSKVKNEGKKPRTVRSSINRKTFEDNNDNEDDDLWFHDNSIKSSSIKPSAVFSHTEEPIDLTNDDGPLSDLPPVTAKIRPSSSSQTLHSEDDEEDELSSEEDEEGSKVANNLSYLNTVEKSKKSMTGARRKSKEDNTTTLKIGDIVRIKLIGHSKSTIGRIVSIEGKYGKFHIPNRSSQGDTWHPLNEFQNCNDPNGNEESDDNDELKGMDEEQRKIIEGPKMNYVMKPVNYSVTQKLNLDRYDSLVKTSDHTALQSDLFFLHRHLQDQSHLNNSSRLKWMKGFAIGKVLSDHVQKQRRKASSSSSSSTTPSTNNATPPVNLNSMQAKAIFLASSKHEHVPSSTAVPRNPSPKNPSKKIKTTPSTHTQTISGWPLPSASATSTTNNLKYTILPSNNTAPSSEEIPSSLIITPESHKIKDEIKTTEGEEIEQKSPNLVKEEMIDEGVEEEVIEDDAMIPIEEHVRHNRDERKEKLDVDDKNDHEDEDEDEVPMMNDVAGVRKEDIINFDEIDTTMSKPSAVRVVSPEESREALP